MAPCFAVMCDANVYVFNKEIGVSWCVHGVHRPLASVRLHPRRASGLRRRGCLQGRCLPSNRARPRGRRRRVMAHRHRLPLTPTNLSATLRGGRRPPHSDIFLGSVGLRRGEVGLAEAEVDERFHPQGGGGTPLGGRISSTSGGISSKPGGPTSASMGCHPYPVGDSPAEPAADPFGAFPPVAFGAGKVEAAGPGFQRSSIRPPNRLRGPSPPRGWGWA